LIVNLIDQHVPIGNVPTTLLKVGRLDNVLQQHRIEVKGIIGAPKWNHTLGSIVLEEQTVQNSKGQTFCSTHYSLGVQFKHKQLTHPPFFHSQLKELFRLPLPLFQVAFLAPQRGSRHVLFSFVLMTSAMRSKAASSMMENGDGMSKSKEQIRLTSSPAFSIGLWSSPRYVVPCPPTP
jgi:hypothetical protein